MVFEECKGILRGFLRVSLLAFLTHLALKLLLLLSYFGTQSSCNWLFFFTGSTSTWFVLLLTDFILRRSTVASLGSPLIIILSMLCFYLMVVFTTTLIICIVSLHIAFLMKIVLLILFLIACILFSLIFMVPTTASASSLYLIMLILIYLILCSILLVIIVGLIIILLMIVITTTLLTRSFLIMSLLPASLTSSFAYFSFLMRKWNFFNVVIMWLGTYSLLKLWLLKSLNILGFILETATATLKIWKIFNIFLAIELWGFNHCTRCFWCVNNSSMRFFRHVHTWARVIWLTWRSWLFLLYFSRVDESWSLWAMSWMLL